VRCPANHHRYPELPVVIFPGNVGDESALAKAYEHLAFPRGVDAANPARKTAGEAH
jgi:hypothetical protein